MNERRSDRYLSIAFSVLIHGAIIGALAFGWWRFRKPTPAPQTLAIEASTVLENARLLQEEQAKHAMEEELRLARTIQQSLLPRSLPAAGWLRASGSSLASHEVGGDYYDVTRLSAHCWSAVVADVSGKGVSSALLASLLQGALITATEHPDAMGHRMERLNRFLLDRTGGEKYATVFYSLLHEDGRMYYVNAAHCPPLVVRARSRMARSFARLLPTPRGAAPWSAPPTCSRRRFSSTPSSAYNK